MNNYSFVQYTASMKIPDGVYNARYNKEPCVLRIEDSIPVYVSFLGFLNADGESRSSAIFDKKGIMHSNVEILLPAQQLPLI